MDTLARRRAGRSRVRVVAVASLFAFATAAFAQAPAPLSLRVAAPTVATSGDARDVTVTITNTSPAAVLILPNMIRLAIAGAGAEYVPYPGPPIDPSGSAHELAPGTSSAVTFRDLSDRRGIWRLPPGEYGIVARYDVPPALAPPPSIADPSRLWRGATASPPATMRIR